MTFWAFVDKHWGDVLGGVVIVVGFICYTVFMISAIKRVR